MAEAEAARVVSRLGLAPCGAVLIREVGGKILHDELKLDGLFSTQCRVREFYNKIVRTCALPLGEWDCGTHLSSRSPRSSHARNPMRNNTRSTHAAAVTFHSRLFTTDFFHERAALVAVTRL